MKKKGAKTSIEKALDLIETLKEKEHLGVTELSSILGLNKNNVFRILATLEVKGIVEQDKETEHYKLGMKLLSLEHAYLQSLKFLKVVRPFIRALRNKLQESVYISILHKNSIVYIFSEDAKRSVLVNSRIGRRFTANKTAAGKALKKAYETEEFPVEEDWENAEPEVAEIASVIRDDHNHPIAAVSIVLPAERAKKEDLQFMKKSLQETCREASERLKRS
ncbi:IclR family transcriptional regulator [Persephonella sp. IF05-L8]|uniref:IclR family transcriptional regulator domain-containing protein n=1 Tax=Persephonella sp. IF05-L8 TaxID=1158338 RepID=UPI00049834BF